MHPRTPISRIVSRKMTRTMIANCEARQRRGRRAFLCILQVFHLEDHGGGGSLLLDRFLTQSETHAESVVDTGDFDAVEFRRGPAPPMLEEGGASDLESTHAADDLDEPDQAREMHSRQNQEQMSPFPMRQPSPPSPGIAPILPQA
jgi:hypothetical protein